MAARRKARRSSGLDHYCLSVSGFDKAAEKGALARFSQVFPDWPSNNVWLEDPGGHLIQIAPSANEPKLPAIVRGAVAVDRFRRIHRFEPRELLD